MPWTLLVIWMVTIYWFSDQPFSGEITEHTLGPYNVPVRKSAHMTEFAILFLLARWSLNTTLQKSGDLTAFLLVTIYAALDEWHQSFVPGRSACITDIFLDLAGALVMWSILFLLRPRLLH